MGVEPIVTISSANAANYQSFAKAIENGHVASAKKGTLLSHYKGLESDIDITLTGTKNHTYVFDYKIDFNNTAETEDGQKDRTLYRVWEDKNHNGVVDSGDTVSIRDELLKPFSNSTENETASAFKQVGDLVSHTQRNQTAVTQSLTKAEAQSGLTKKDLSTLSQAMLNEDAKITHQGKLTDGRIFVIAQDEQGKGIVYMGTPGKMTRYDVESYATSHSGPEPYGNTVVTLSNSQGSFSFLPSKQIGKASTFNGQPLTEFE